MKVEYNEIIILGYNNNYPIRVGGFMADPFCTTFNHLEVKAIVQDDENVPNVKVTCEGGNGTKTFDFQNVTILSD